MLSSSFNPICSKQQRAMHTKNLSNVQLGGKNLFFMQINLSTAHIFFQMLHHRAGILIQGKFQAFVNNQMVPHLIRDKAVQFF